MRPNPHNEDEKIVLDNSVVEVNFNNINNRLELMLSSNTNLLFIMMFEFFYLHSFFLKPILVSSTTLFRKSFSLLPTQEYLI